MDCRGPRQWKMHIYSNLERNSTKSGRSLSRSASRLDMLFLRTTCASSTCQVNYAHSELQTPSDNSAGYGDDNQIRTALIDKFRGMAHFEIVVAPTSRVISSVTQARYLDRSIRRLGAHNTLLITNKSEVRSVAFISLYSLTLYIATL
jgi:hypothetical protein